MTVRSVQDQIKSVLGRSVAEGKARGVSNAPLEATALFESVALNLLLHPRAAIYFLLLARNALQSAVTVEMAAVDTLSQTALDLANETYQISDTTSLQQAKAALLQLESMDKISVSSPVFKRFDANISAFLHQQLSPNVRKPGSTSLLRPAAEAQKDFPTNLANLKSLHQDTLQRLYALAVGLDNFLAVPLSTILGITTASRARLDIESMIANPDSASARDMAVTLIANRAALRTLGGAPSPFDPVLSATLPAGYTLKLASDPAAASVSGVVADGFVFPVGAAINISTPSITRAASFPQTTSDLQNQGHLASAQVSYPVTIPLGQFLFLTFTKADGSTVSYKVPLSGSMTLAQVVAAINSVIGSDGTADEYIRPGTSRIIIWANTPNLSLSVNAFFTDPNFISTGEVAVNTSSAHTLLGFNAAQQSSVLGTTPLSTVQDALATYWNDALAVGPGLVITGLDTSPGTYLSFAGTAADTLGLTGLFTAKSPTARLYGSINGVQTDPVDARSLLQPGDLVATSTGSGTIASISQTRISFSSPFSTFNEAPTVTSAVVVAWQSLIAKVRTFLSTWTKTGYQTDLSKVDRALAPLGSSTGPAQMNLAIATLMDLKSNLGVLSSNLSDPSTVLPKGAGLIEKDIIDGILSSLEERKFDRAVDLLLRGQLQEALGVDHQTASFSGAFLKASSDVAQTDFALPNLAKDEGLQAPNRVSRTP